MLADHLNPTTRRSSAEVAAALDRLNDFDWIGFTSRNAVRTVFDWLSARGRHMAATVRVAALGAATARGASNARRDARLQSTPSPEARLLPLR